jgi:hypothetical protein
MPSDSVTPFGALERRSFSSLLPRNLGHVVKGAWTSNAQEVGRGEQEGYEMKGPSRPVVIQVFRFDLAPVDLENSKIRGNAPLTMNERGL